MSAAVTGLMTFEEFERLPEHAGKQELLNGELIELPPAKRKHDIVAHLIRDAIRDAIKQGGRLFGDTFTGMGYRITRNPDSWLIPDVSLTHPNQAGDDYLEGAPLLAIEVVSDANTAEQIAEKVRIYLAHGSSEVWVIYPKKKFAWVYGVNFARIVEDKLATDLIPSLSIDLPSALQ
jgi:Uma2 family endonuclease